MKKGLIIGGIILAVVILIIALFVGQYNGLVEKEESVSQSVGNVQTLIQKRADLIPNVASAVQRYTVYESDTYKAVTEARSKVGSASTVGELNDADNELSKAVDVWVNAVTEAYPELKGDKLFVSLIDEMSSIENEIGYARQSYNEIATDYNKAIRKFPGNVFAGMFGFEKSELFTASESAQNVPNVSDYLK